jgi:acetyl esterase/lipase
MVAISADYRVSSRNHSTVLDSIRDAKSAIRYVRRNAARLGIDPRRIAAGGGSAGGHIAAVAGVIPGLDEPGEDASISSKPDALVLFNPALSLTGDGTAETLSSRPEFAGVDLASISPVRFVSKGAPPAIIFHGKADQLVPYATVEAFTKKSQAAGNRCELVGYEGQGHGFFNQRPGNRYYGETLQSAEKFLASLGYLKAPAAGS